MAKNGNNNGNGHGHGDDDLVYTGVTLERELRDQLRNLAQQNKRSLSKQIEWILEAAIQEFEQRPEKFVLRPEEFVT